MPNRLPAVRQLHFQGQILLERALFCVGCEIIFTGTPHCPRCASGETVWPLAEWVRSVRLSTAAAPPSNILPLDLYRHLGSRRDRGHEGWEQAE
jgi:hypothetical protein